MMVFSILNHLQLTKNKILNIELLLHFTNLIMIYYDAPVNYSDNFSKKSFSLSKRRFLIFCNIFDEVSNDVILCRVISCRHVSHMNKLV